MVEVVAGEAAVGGVISNLATSSVTAASILLIWFLTHKAQNAEREAERTAREKVDVADREERERQAKEHMEKWHSMIKQHETETARLVTQAQGELDRAYRLHERQVQVSELHASLLQKLTSDVKTNQFCPVVRGTTQSHT